MLFAALALASSMLFAGCWGSSSSEVAVTPAPATASGNVQSQVLSTAIVAGKPVVTFTLRDENGAALTPAALLASPGGRLRFFIGRINADGNYVNYFGSAGLPTYNSNGTFATVGEGTYTYTFSKAIDNASQTLNGIVVTGNEGLTHTVAIQIARNFTTNTGKTFQQASNPYFNFRPDGAAVTVTREVVSTSACNECHGVLGLHGGSRRDVQLCILCHYPGVIDPTSGNTVDLKSMVHKIHMGKNLDGNLKGGSYSIAGNEYKTVGYPFWSGDSLITKTPIECVKCHKAGKNAAGGTVGADVDKYKSGPTKNKCTTCHDTLTFTAAETTVNVDNNGVQVAVAARNHSVTYGAGDIDVTGANADNAAKCSGCHDVPAFANTEYSVNSVKGAHTVLERSTTVYTGVNLQIISVDNATVGKKPVVTYKITTDNGSVIDPLASTSSFNVKLGIMPAADYTNANMNDEAQPFTKALKPSSVANGDGSYTVVFDNAVPAGATGIGVVGIEGRKTFTMPTSVRRPAGTTRNVGASAQYYFSVATGAQVTNPAQQRRVSVSLDKCNGCHGRLSFHGGSRANVQECVICHNPKAVAGASDFFNLKDLIHMAHTGKDLDNSVATTYFGGRFATMRFPNDRRNCLACHVDSNPKSFGIPLPAGVVGTSIDNAGAVRNPVAAACVSCHTDTVFTAPHVANQTSGTSEFCVNCHTTGLLIGPDVAHEPVR
jgi:OmcA/MtrC family decaheme c-type cytochrome